MLRYKVRGVPDDMNPTHWEVILVDMDVDPDESITVPEVFNVKVLADDRARSLQAARGQASVIFHASSKIVENEKAIVSPTWETLGGVVSTPGFFAIDIAKVFGRCIGSLQATGTGAELTIVESETELVGTPFSIPDTSGAWQPFSFSTDQLIGLATNTYELRGRLNGASAAKVRFVSLSMLELP